MHIDEAAFRILESRVLADLIKHNASTRLLRDVHCIRRRLSGELTMESHRKNKMLMLCSMIINMKKSYEKVRSEMRGDPDKHILASFDRMTKLLESAKEHDGSASLAVRGLTLVSEGNELRGTKKPGSVLAAFPGTRGRVIEVTIRGEKAVPVVETPAESESEREASQVPRGSAAGDLTGLPELTPLEVIKLIKPLLITTKIADEVISETGFVLWKDRDNDLEKGGASFEIGFRTSEDAFHTRRLMEYHYVKDENGTRYSLEALRKHCSMGDPDEDDDADDLKDMIQPGRDIDDMDILKGAEGQVIGWEVRDRNLQETAHPEPRRMRGRGNFKMGSTPNERKDNSGMTDSEGEEEDLLICEQCCSLVDQERPPAYNSSWIHSEEEGYGIDFNNKLFCNQPCLSKHLVGSKPTEPSELILKYREGKLGKSAKTC
jgi:hypothetical protein